ncbi:hypothetical protein F4819DRAFT_468232 [Hypoxylon fuscum]|nr:hypothetical protein F4819DRAFT_468232 [Hypoxylon fuscum]
MQATCLLASVMAFAGLVVAEPVDWKVIINVEASHGGAGSGLTNTTVNMPWGEVYTNKTALDAVSTLYLIGTTSQDLPAGSIYCIPYKNTDGTGSHGLLFDLYEASRLSTNTVQVGSITCGIYD